MPTKTDRILSYLPSTFRARPQPTALYTLVNAFGRELQQGENSLAALMQAHWVDHADRGGEVINDLLKIASMYGLVPRADEDVEAFREHLKHYIRIFLEGSTTVQGILRVTAQALALQIVDDYADMDTWWTRDSDGLLTLTHARDDATLMLFGAADANVTGSDAQPAQILGSVGLSDAIELRNQHLLKLKIDQQAPLEIDLSLQSSDASSVTLQQIIAAINAALPAGMTSVASAKDARLRLRSPTNGVHSRLELLEIAGDASAAVLGIAPKTWHGHNKTPAQAIAQIDLGSGVDLSKLRFLRLSVDDNLLAEIDCAGADPAHTTLDELRDAINAAFGFALARHDGQHLTLTSPTQGNASTIGFLEPAAQNATALLFGAPNSLYSGRDARAAIATGIRDLSGGIDLSENSNIRIETDTTNPITINCAGPDPANTQLPEIVAAINSVLGPGSANHNGRSIRLHSTTIGAASFILFRTPKQDATESIFGIGARIYTGNSARPALYSGRPPMLSHGNNCPDSAGCLDVSTVRFLTLTLDDKPAVQINLAQQLELAGADPRHATLNAIAAVINDSLGEVVAKIVDDHVQLASATTGASSKVIFSSRIDEQQSRFVTRAWITGEASESVFGFNSREIRGAPASAALFKGTPDLRHGVDLSLASLLRLQIDNGPAQEIDCAGQRPRATLINEIVSRLNSTLGVDKGIASHDGRRLLLTSPTQGANSRIEFSQPRGADASGLLLGVDAGLWRGSEAGSVSFESTVEIGATIDLSGLSHINLGVDGAAPVDIDCAGADPAATRLSEIMIAINVALAKGVATRRGDHLVLGSTAVGTASQLEFAVPDSSDATSAIFGINAPRGYQGFDASAAQLTGVKDLSAAVNLQNRSLLLLAIDGNTPRQVDCSSEAADPQAVTAPDIIAAINSALDMDVAELADGRFLRLRSPTTGLNSRIKLDYFGGADALSLLFGGDAPALRQGVNAQAAELQGDTDLLKPIDLRLRDSIRLAVNGGAPRTIHLAGVAPATTFLDEMISAINAVFPGLASATADDRLLLSAPDAGEQSHIALLPSRYLELIEYPAQAQQFSIDDIGHASRWLLVNSGVTTVNTAALLKTQQGVCGPGLVNVTTGWRLLLSLVLGPGDAVKIWQDGRSGIQATVHRADGEVAPVAAVHIHTRQLIPSPQPAGQLLDLPRGKSECVFTECIASRFNAAYINQDKYAGGECHELGVFNVSSFAEPDTAFPDPVFAAACEQPLAPVSARFEWSAYQPGAFTVNLPADLPAHFGGRFNQARFAQPQGSPETFNGAVTEPDTDPMFIGTLFEQGDAVTGVVASKLVRAVRTTFVPLGWKAVAIPFRQPLRLTLGSPQQVAKLYLNEPDGTDFIEISAITAGDWGNAISLAVRTSGPAQFDVDVFYSGAHFENARQSVQGAPLKRLVADSLKPGPIGVLQAKASGVRARVTRDGK